MTVNTHMNGTAHMDDVAPRASRDVNVMKAMTGFSWGQDKATLFATYKALIRHKFSFRAPVWFPNASATAIKRLQVIQNNALCVALGCHK